MPRWCQTGMLQAQFALLAAVEDYSRREMYQAPTDRLQTRHQPAPKLVSPKKTVCLTRVKIAEATRCKCLLFMSNRPTTDLSNFFCR